MSMRDMIFKTLTIRNLLRYGNKPFSIDLSALDGLTIIHGTNGSGKSSILEALSFVLTGKPIGSFDTGSLVNNTNKKELLVTLDIVIGDELVRIIRGQKPGVCKLYRKPESAPGDIQSKEFDKTEATIATTDKAIKRLLGFGNELFKCAIVSSTRTPTFFELDSAGKKLVIENLFTFDELTEKGADAKKARTELEGKLAVRKAAVSEQLLAREKFVKQVEWVKSQRDAFEVDRAAKIADLEKVSAGDTDWDALLEASKRLDELRIWHEALDTTREQISKQRAAIATTIKRLNAELAAAQASAASVSNIDFTLEEANLALCDTAKADHDMIMTAVREQESILRERAATVSRARGQLAAVTGSDVCPECGQAWPDAADRDSAKAAAEAELKAATIEYAAIASEIDELKKAAASVVSDLPRCRFRNLNELFRAKGDSDSAESIVKGIKDRIADQMAADAPLAADETETIKVMIEVEATVAEMPDLDEPDEIVAQRAKHERLAAELERYRTAVNPHDETLAKMIADTPEEVDVAELEEMAVLIEHYQFLEVNLTHKNSPIRREITSRYLPFLNDRLRHYMDALRIDYTVTFNDDLSVTVVDESDGDIHPGAMSGGETERSVMALNWAFRDVFEEINGVRVAFSGVDERLDTGLDEEGGESSMIILNEMSLQKGRNIWLLTHKKEFDTFADHRIQLSRKGRFSEVEIVE